MSSPEARKSGSRRKWIILGVALAILVLFPTPHFHTVATTKSEVVDSEGFTMGVNPGDVQQKIFTNLGRSAGINGYDHVKFHIESTTDVRLIITTDTKTIYDNIGTVHVSQIDTDTTSSLTLIFSNTVASNPSFANLSGNILVTYMYQEETRESSGLLPWWVP